MIQVIIYILAILLTVISFVKDKGKTKIALKKGAKAFEGILPTVLSVMMVVGIILAIVDKELIAKLIGPSTGILGIFIAVFLGSITMMAGFIAFPLGATLMSNGAGVSQVTALISSLMLVGFLTFPLEKKYWGSKVTFLRNSLGIIISIIVALVMGWVY